MTDAPGHGFNPLPAVWPNAFIAVQGSDDYGNLTLVLDQELWSAYDVMTLQRWYLKVVKTRWCCKSLSICVEKFVTSWLNRSLLTKGKIGWNTFWSFAFRFLFKYILWVFIKYSYCNIWRWVFREIAGGINCLCELENKFNSLWCDCDRCYRLTNFFLFSIWML